MIKSKRVGSVSPEIKGVNFSRRSGGCFAVFYNYINDLAEERAIVLHVAAYATESFIKRNGLLGRSVGWPAVSSEMCAPLIQVLKMALAFLCIIPMRNM